MSDGRKRLSGHQYKKNVKEKLEREKEEITKSAKIDMFFTKTRSEGETTNKTPDDDDESNNEEQNIGHPPGYTNTQTDEENNMAVELDDEEHAIVEKLGMTSKVPAVYSRDPYKWTISESTIDYFAEHGFEQNKNADFSKSKLEYPDQARYFSPKLYERVLINGETGNRSWLIYSESAHCIYCGPCKLFKKDFQFGKNGFNDWKNQQKRVDIHENSIDHKSCMVAIKSRGSKLGHVNKLLNEQTDKEISYWTEVLKRVVAVVKKLTSRGIALRCQNEIVGSPNNGNFLMALELLAEFDPFLAQHIKKYSNPGSGHTNYLSSTIYEEFIKLMGNKMRDVFVADIRKAKYYSIIFDSTPDMSHIDQLSFVIRYVQECGTPVERFLVFIPNTGHKSAELTKTVTETLISFGIDISDCRGQSYDNASNMSGIYSGLQARIKEINDSAEYVPCAAHSLNLVCVCSASSCAEAMSFFGTLQELYNFFTASTHRWEIVQTLIQGNPTIKRPSATQWSARDDACLSLNESYGEIIEALLVIEEDSTEKALTRCEAKGLRQRLQRPETAFMTTLWSSLLNRLNLSSKKLQSVDIDISMVLELYSSLIKYVQTVRTEFDVYENRAKLLSDEEYETVKSRKKKKKISVW